MSRYLDWFEAVTPEEYPLPVATDRDPDELATINHAWTRADVLAYRTALQALGFTPDQIAAQIAKDCGFPKVDLVPRPRSFDLTQLTETELRWMSEAQEEV